MVHMLAEGFSTRRGRRGALIHHDARQPAHLRARRGARLTAITSGGTIPDTADYQVILEPQAHVRRHGERRLRDREPAGRHLPARQRLVPHPARRAGPRARRGRARRSRRRIPFWLGEAPGAHRRAVGERVAAARRGRGAPRRRRRGRERLAGWRRPAIDAAAAVQLVEYLAAARAALGALPTQQTIVLERFFDEAGGMQLVHPLARSAAASTAPGGWRCASASAARSTSSCRPPPPRTRSSCRSATAHSFALEDVARYLHSNTVRPLLVQALCAAPMFPARWRWNATIALALLRFRGGQKVPAPLPRMEAEDLLAAVFPDQVACAENLRRRPRDPRPSAGAPDDPRLPRGRHGHRGPRARCCARSRPASIRCVARDLTEPSPLAHEILSAPALRLPRRRAARGAPHPGGGQPPLARPAERRRPRPRSTPRRSRGSRRRPGPTPPTPTSCTTRCCGSASSPRPRRRRGSGLAGAADEAGRRAPRDPARCRHAPPVGRGRAAAAARSALSAGARSSRWSRHRRPISRSSTARMRCAKWCAGG